jgi:hypothetical protein
MTRGVRWYLVGSFVLVGLGALVALVGCSGHWIAEREAWRHDAEVACLNSGAVKEGPAKVRISAINGPGMCGADFPLKVAALGDSAVLGYLDEPPRPPGSVPNASLPARWPVPEPYPAPPPYPAPGAYPPPAAYPSSAPYGRAPIDTRPLPPVEAQPAPVYEQTYPPRYDAPAPASRYDAPAPRYQPPPAARYEPRPGPPVSLTPPGVDGDPDEPMPEAELPGAPRPYPGRPGSGTPADRYPPEAAPAVPLGPPRGPAVTGSAGPVEVKPAATLACPIVSALDRWIAESVQPAALRWFGQPVAEIKQISAYSCRGMNGNPGARISEHAFGNALDIASFELSNGRKISVQHGWRGAPEEQGFLRDVQAAACAQFSTVLAPGSNVYHYNHIHVDLMQRSSGRRICEPAAVSGEVVAARAGGRYAAQRNEPGVTGSIKPRSRRYSPGSPGDNDGRLPLAIPGED